MKWYCAEFVHGAHIPVDQVQLHVSNIRIPSSDSAATHATKAQAPVGQVPLHVSRSWDMPVVSAMEPTGPFQPLVQTVQQNNCHDMGFCRVRLGMKEHMLQSARCHCMHITSEESFPLVTMEPKTKVPYLVEIVQQHMRQKHRLKSARCPCMIQDQGISLRWAQWSRLGLINP